MALTSKPQADVNVFLSSTDHQATAFDAANPANAFLTVHARKLERASERSLHGGGGRCNRRHSSVRKSFTDTLSADPNYHGSVVLPVVITDNDVAEFGDAPAPYPTKVVDGGAFHIPIGPRLGANRDSEIDGIPVSRRRWRRQRQSQRR